MEVAVKPYDLPDTGLLNSALPFQVMVWRPDSTMIILGQSNQSENSLMTEQVLLDQIDVYKRPSGGETVMLTANTLVISLSFTASRFHNPQVYFKRINKHIIAALNGLGVNNLYYKGISDITLGDKKILGSSIFRNRDRVFYHAVLNVREKASIISKYILHPLREPDYRRGRNHLEFVTSLAEEGYNISMETLSESIEKELNRINGYIYE